VRPIEVKAAAADERLAELSALQQAMGVAYVGKLA
jgi:hypothetical protein